jgi:hypothetical protein
MKDGGIHVHARDHQRFLLPVKSRNAPRENRAHLGFFGAPTFWSAFLPVRLDERAPADKNVGAPIAKTAR